VIFEYMMAARCSPNSVKGKMLRMPVLALTIVSSDAPAQTACREARDAVVEHRTGLSIHEVSLPSGNGICGSSR
jgi:hypothetical protein